MSLACPKCASADVRRLSLVHAEGVRGRLVTGTARSVGAGRARQAAPPPRKQWMAWALAAIACLILAVIALPYSALGAWLALGIGAVSLWLVRRARRYNAGTLPGLQARWERRMMCVRCGEVFDPAP